MRMISCSEARVGKTVKRARDGYGKIERESV